MTDLIKEEITIPIGREIIDLIITEDKFLTETTIMIGDRMITEITTEEETIGMMMADEVIKIVIIEVVKITKEKLIEKIEISKSLIDRAVLLHTNQRVAHRINLPYLFPLI